MDGEGVQSVLNNSRFLPEYYYDMIRRRWWSLLHLQADGTHSSNEPINFILKHGRVAAASSTSSSPSRSRSFLCPSRTQAAQSCHTFSAAWILELSPIRRRSSSPAVCRIDTSRRQVKPVCCISADMSSESLLAHTAAMMPVADGQVNEGSEWSVVGIFPIMPHPRLQSGMSTLGSLAIILEASVSTSRPCIGCMYRNTKAYKSENKEEMMKEESTRSWALFMGISNQPTHKI